MRLLVVGAGATGGYFGGRLAQAGRDVTFLVRTARAGQLRETGLRLLSPHGDVTLTPQIVTANEIQHPYDVVILTVKSYALKQAVTDITPAVGPATMIFPLLNGMRHIDVLAERFGDAPILGGVCLVAATLTPEGYVKQLGGMQELGYGEREGGISPRITALDDEIKGAGFNAAASSDIMQDMWEKWVFLASLGGITCLMRGTIGEIEAAPGGADHALQLLSECASVASAAGFQMGEAFLRARGEALTTKGSPLASSMYRDLQAGSEVEVDQILGDMLHRAHQMGIETPLLSTAFTALRVYQTRLETKNPKN
jgi:2-dehydropantoate 2-reductase